MAAVETYSNNAHCTGQVLLYGSYESDGDENGKNITVNINLRTVPKLGVNQVLKVPHLIVI